MLELREAERAVADHFGLRKDVALSADRRTRIEALSSRLGDKVLDLSQVPDLPSAQLATLADTFTQDVEGLNVARSLTKASYPLKTVRHMPLDQIDADWREAQARLWPFSFFARRKVAKLLQTYADAGEGDPGEDLKALREVCDRDAALSRNPLAVVGTTGEAWDGAGTAEAARQAIEFRAAAASLRPEVEDATRHTAATDELATGTAGTARDALKGFVDAEAVVAERQRAFVELGGRVSPDASVSELEGGLETLATERARLADWVRWIEVRNQADVAGLGPLVEALEDGRVVGPADHAFERAYAAWWLPWAMDESEELRRFRHWDHESAIETFRRLDARAGEIAPAEVMRRVAHDLPARDGVPRKSELGVLRHQLGLKRPSMPIRRLLESLPQTFGKLAPCVLMSPLSVAQYLPAGRAAFDLVIFDEASQITTWDAIGAIARGRQTIVVGDPKQLPPTNFFGRADDEDEALPEVERDMPSILDEVAAAGVSERHLAWHYRSRDEALIAFSNRFYYGGRLVTFPAPSADSGALTFHNVDGVYVRGSGGRVNRKEAMAVADTVRQRLREWLRLPEADRPTLGVITFNSEQQSLVLDLLDKVRRDDADLEWFFADDREEPVIVKNLENIQGDERDVMLFSTTFGPDDAGKLTMNFGPLNNSGGERRLNVAVTRSRRELHVFSSITADQIDLGRTRAEGVKDLKAFLDYAERGAIALPARDEGSLGPSESVFEEAVADAIRSKGWEVRPQVGVSGFRVDLGIVHPDQAGRYLCGVECDGAQYHSSATARDRDKVRQSVLEGLGWSILRIWSTDWFRNADAVAERVHEELGRLLETDRGARESAQANSGTRDSENQSAQDGSVDGTDAEALDVDDGAPGRAGPMTHGRDVPPVNVDQVADGSRAGLNADRFYEPDYAPVIRRLTLDIALAEGPLPLDRLTRRVAQEHGWQRAGKRIRQRVQDNLGAVECHDEEDRTFVWAPGSHTPRVSFGGLAGRSVRDISRAEVASVIDDNARRLASADDPVLALARVMGVGRLTVGTRAYLRHCLRWHGHCRD